MYPDDSLRFGEGEGQVVGKSIVLTVNDQSTSFRDDLFLENNF